MWFQDIDKKKVQGYINSNPPDNFHIGKMIDSAKGMILFAAFYICISSAASKKNIVFMAILLLLAFVIYIWTLFLRENVNENKEKIILALGVQGMYISFGFLFAAYQLICAVVTNSFWYGVLGLFLYVILCLSFIWSIIKRIKSGYYCQAKKKVKPTAIGPVAIAGFSMLIANATGRKLNQFGIIIVMCICSMLLSIVFSFMVHYLLKYYLIRTLNLKVESKWND